MSFLICHMIFNVVLEFYVQKYSKYIDKEFIFDVMIASDIIDFLNKILDISQTKRRISQTSQLISQNQKDRKRRFTNNPFKFLFIALFLTKQFLKSQSQNLREQISQCRS